MQQQKLGLRIDVAELKGMIVKRSKGYFYYLKRFLNLKLSKSEFYTLRQRVLGRDNLPLHNQLIQSVLKYVCSAKTRPVGDDEFPAKTATEVGQGQGHVQYGVSSTSVVTCVNGVASPRKARVDSRDWKHRNQHRLAEKGKDKTMLEPLGRQCPSRAADGVEQCDRPSYSSPPFLAPLGKPFCSASIGRSHKTFSGTAADTHLSFCNSGKLSETETLITRLEKILVAQNLGGVSPECANLLNRMLEVYLKRLIMLCINLVEAKSEEKKQLVQGNYMNSMLSNNQQYTVTSGGMGAMYKERPHPAVCNWILWRRWS